MIYSCKVEITVKNGFKLILEDMPLDESKIENPDQEVLQTALRLLKINMDLKKFHLEDYSMKIIKKHKLGLN